MSGRPGITLELRHEAFDQAVARLRAVTDDLTDPGREIARVLADSVRMNFVAGGRPDRWRPSKRALAQSGQTLVDTARLQNSITSEFDAANGRVKVGTNVMYAPAHHFGAHKTVVQNVREHTAIRRKAFGRDMTPRPVRIRAHTRNMRLNLPARPFMMIQDEDWETIGDIIQIAIDEAMNGA